MAEFMVITKYFLLFFLINHIDLTYADDILGCGGFVRSHVNLDFTKIEIGLYTKEGSLKEKTECAPTNGYYFLPLYEKGDYVLKVHPPAGWSFEPSQVELSIDGTTDQCSSGQDIDFAFNGFGITGKVITAGLKQGPIGIAVQLVNDNGEVRNTVTTVGGDFHFTPVIPGKYTVKTSHPRWKLEPSQALVVVKEGNTALPVGALAVKGYDVRGSVTSFGSPLSGLYVLLYSKEDNPQLRVEGCKTALLQGVPDSPICYSITDSNGEFSFGLVPAGHYKLLALSTAPGQASVTYNVKPDSVPFSVLHDSLFIKNAFEVHGFTVVGSVIKAVGGAGLAGTRVLLDGRAAGTTDASGKFTLPNLSVATYTIQFQHEQCEIDDLQLQVPSGGPARAPAAVAARWRVCGAVTPPDHRDITIQADQGPARLAVHVTPENKGKWCTFLPPGMYSANVDVTDQEQNEGLQYFPVIQKISVGNGPVDDVAFSQLKGTVTGKVVCQRAADCEGLPVMLRMLSPDGAYRPQVMNTTVKNGAYAFAEVPAGSAELALRGARLCWRAPAQRVAVRRRRVAAPDFLLRGYVLRARASHPLEVEYAGEGESGVLAVPAGASELCVPRAGRYTLTPRACHKFQPPVVEVATADSDDHPPPTVHFVAVAHEATVHVLTPEPVDDLMLHVQQDSRSTDVGPLAPQPHPDGGYAYSHSLYLADGSLALVTPRSGALLFAPAGAQQLWARAACQPRALTFRAARALTLAGRTRPPVAGARVTLAAAGVKQTQTTGEDGAYKFGPLDASKEYSVTVEKESYVFSAPDERGDVVARKLADITVQLLDDADSSPLQGALVSVSGGAYRRNALTAADGRLRLPALAPDQYYIKPNMKEYRFTPPHAIVALPDGESHHLTLRAARVAWSCAGRLAALGGAGCAGAALAAAPRAGAPAACVTEEATTEASGAFRIRGLLPNCVYTIQLKESSLPELAGLKLVKAPATVEVKNNKDIENVVLIAHQTQQLTDVHVSVRAHTVDHYRSLRLTLAPDAGASAAPLYSTKLDPAGFSQTLNPGLMYALPRLPADGKSYVLQLESTLSKATHSYEDAVFYFTSNGDFKNFNIEFAPKVKSAEQELRQTSLLLLPALALLALLALLARREGAAARAGALLRRVRAARARPAPPRAALLDRASIDHIVSAVNAAGKKPSKKKAQ